MAEENWTVRFSNFECVRAVGPMDEHDECLHMLYDKGFGVRQSGPYTDGSMWPKVDVTRFLIIAEREIESEI